MFKKFCEIKESTSLAKFPFQEEELKKIFKNYLTKNVKISRVSYLQLYCYTALPHGR